MTSFLVGTVGLESALHVLCEWGPFLRFVNAVMEVYIWWDN